MKRWAARILAALLTFAAGACLVALFKLRPARATTLARVETKISLPETDDAPAPEKVRKPFVVDISPYDIKRRVDINRRERERGDLLDLAPLLETLRIERSEVDDFCFQCNGYYEAAIFTLELDGSPGRETILRLNDSGGSYLHLIFKRTGARKRGEAGWKFFGFIGRHTWWYNPEPAPRTLTIGGKHYLRIDDSPGHGSGYGADEVGFYEVNEEGVKEVLDFGSGLFDSIGDPGIDSEIKVVETRYEDETAKMVLEARSTYTARSRGLERFPLFSTKRRVTFVRRADAQEFTLDPSKSEMSAEEFDYLQRFSDGEDYLDKFVSYNYESLRKIATGKDEKLKEWLRGFLATCDSCSERERLRKLLD